MNCSLVMGELRVTEEISWEVLLYIKHTLLIIFSFANEALMAHLLFCLFFFSSSSNLVRSARTSLWFEKFHKQLYLKSMKYYLEAWEDVNNQPHLDNIMGLFYFIFFFLLCYFFFCVVAVDGIALSLMVMNLNTTTTFSFPLTLVSWLISLVSVIHKRKLTKLSRVPMQCMQRKKRLFLHH